MSNNQEALEAFKDQLKSGIVKFVFSKTDGTPRTAFGTLNPEIIPKYDEKKVENLVVEATDFLVGFGTGTLIEGDDEKLGKALSYFTTTREASKKEPNPTIQVYYDLEKKGFRSFKIDNLKKVL